MKERLINKNMLTWIGYPSGRAGVRESEMKQELEEYRSEAAHLKNQQATVRRLEERNRLLEQQVSQRKLHVVLTLLFWIIR